MQIKNSQDARVFRSAWSSSTAGRRRSMCKVAAEGVEASALLAGLVGDTQDQKRLTDAARVLRQP